MSKPSATGSEKVWESIENEKRRDRQLRRICGSAWGATIVLVLILALMIGVQVYQMARAARVGALPWMSVVGTGMPLIIVLGILSVLIATLSTVGVFLRFRTASLTEIQLRLAALEEMLTSRGEAGNR